MPKESTPIGIFSQFGENANVKNTDTEVFFGPQDKVVYRGQGYYTLRTTRDFVTTGVSLIVFNGNSGEYHRVCFNSCYATPDGSELMWMNMGEFDPHNNQVALHNQVSEAVRFARLLSEHTAKKPQLNENLMIKLFPAVKKLLYEARKLPEKQLSELRELEWELPKVMFHAGVGPIVKV